MQAAGSFAGHLGKAQLSLVNPAIGDELERRRPVLLEQGEWAWRVEYPIGFFQCAKGEGL